MGEKRGSELATNAALVAVCVSVPEAEKVIAEAIRTAVNEALSDAAIQVFVVRQEALSEDDDKGTYGWLQDAENRINALKLP